MHSEVASRPEVAFNSLGHVARSQNRFIDSLSPEPIEQQLKKRCPRDLRHRLWPISNDRAESGAKTSAEHESANDTGWDVSVTIEFFHRKRMRTVRFRFSSANSSD